MRKLLIIVLMMTPVLFLAGCGSKTPEQKAAENLLDNGMWFMKNIAELWEAKDNGNLTDEEMAKQVMWEYADFIWSAADGTEDELTDEEKEMLDVMFTDPEKLEKIVDEAMEDMEENE